METTRKTFLPVTASLRARQFCKGVDQIDADKIDVVGSKDQIPMPFFRDAPPSVWPQLLPIEDACDRQSKDILSFLAKSGYATVARSKLNVMLRLQNKPEQRSS